MSVAMNNKISMKPGFGKKLEVPSFNKQKLSSTKGADSSVFSGKTSLKDSVSQSISTTTLNRTISTNYTQSGSSVFGSRSSTFVPGNHLLGVSDYYRDRNELRNGITTGIGYDPSVGGYRSGKHDLELFTGGLTQRSERRMMQRAGMVDLSRLQESSISESTSNDKKMSLLEKIALGVGGGAVAVGLGVGIAKTIKANKAAKAGNEESDIAKLNAQTAKQTPKTATPKGGSDVKQTKEIQITSSNPDVQALQSAKTSAECNEISTKLTEQNKTIDSTITLNKTALTMAEQGKETATLSLNTATEGISSEKQNIQKQDGTITKLQSQLSTLKSTNGDASAISKLEQQIKEAEASKAQSEANLKKFESQKEQASKDIAQYEQDISNINSDLKSLNAEKAEVDKGLKLAAKKAEELAAKEK